METVTKPHPSGYDRLNNAVENIGITGAHYRIILLVAAGSLFNVVEQYNVGFAAPLIIDKWHISSGQAGLLSSVTFGAMAISSLVSGKLADRYGRKPIFMWNVALFTFGALLAAFSPTYAVLLMARIIVGLGLGGEMALGFTFVAELIPTRRRGSAAATISLLHGGVGIFAASGLAALILGPLSAVFGGDQIAWRVLLGVMFLPAVLLLFYRRYVPESPRYLLKTGRLAELNTTLSLLAANRLRNRGDVPVTQYIDSGESLANPEDVVRLSELFQHGRAKATAIAWTLGICLFGAVATATTLLPLVLTNAGYSSGTAATLATVVNFGGLLGAVAGILFAHRLPRRRVCFGMGLVAMAAAVILAQSLSSVATLVVAFAFIFVLEVIAGSFWAYVPELYSTRVRGFGTGAAVTAALLVGATVSPIVGGTLLDSHGKAGLFLLLAALCLVFALAAWSGPETYGEHLREDG